MSMIRRAIPDASSLDEAIRIIRGNWLQAIEQHHLQYSETSMIGDILDIRCSVGISTRLLADKFPSAKVTVSEFLMNKNFLSQYLVKAAFLVSLNKRSLYARYRYPLCLICLLQGLDLSPYFLAVAQHKEKKRGPRKVPIRWIHAKGEDTGLPSKSFDLVSIAFVVCLAALAGYST